MALWGFYRRAWWVVPSVVAIALVMLAPTSLVSGQAGVSASAAAVGGSGAAVAAASPAAVSASSQLTSSELQSLLQERPSLATTPWIENLEHPAKGSAPLVSLPDLDLLAHPGKVVNGEVSLFNTVQPASMGLASYGIGSSGPYALNVSNIVGSITFETPPAASNPGASEVINPAGEHLGSIGSPSTFGIQLNTILQNIELPGGVSNGTFWTQNVVNMNSTSIHFVQDVFNFTYGSGAYIAPGTTILSGCSGFNLGLMLAVYGGVYQCVGGNVPISAADFPLTLSLYNNASVVGNRDVLTFGYLATGANGFVSGGNIDTLVFNSPGAPSTPPAEPPQFTINGYAYNGFGLFDDAEIVIVGGIEGSNAVFTAINNTISLQYSNTSVDYQSFPSEFDFGDDTGETSTGIATYWTGTDSANAATYEDAGPTLLYGLWGTPASLSAAPGAIHVSGTISPDYGFVFAGNVAPSVSSTNLSYVPTVAGTGSFSTWVPPAAAGSIIPNGWYFQSWAPKAAELNGSNAGGPGPVTSSVTDYDISLAPSSSLNAPLYMVGNAQAASLALNVTGSSSAPFDFSNLVIGLNITFRHVNDYGFPSFVLFQAQGLTEPLEVNDLSQSNTSTTYIYDGAASVPPGFPSPPAVFKGLQNYSAQFNVWDCQDATLTNLTLVGEKAYAGGWVVGGAVLLWDDTDASVTDSSVANASFGIFVGDSQSTHVQGISASGGSNAVDDIGSTGTSVRGVAAVGFETFGVYVLGSSLGVYQYVNASAGAYAVYTGGYVGAAYYNERGSYGATVSDLTATDAAVGAYDSVSLDDAFSGVAAAISSDGVIVYASNDDTVTGTSTSDGSVGVVAESAISTVVSDTSATDLAIAVELFNTTGAAVSGVTVSDLAIAVFAELTVSTTISGVTATSSGLTRLYVGEEIFGVPFAVIDSVFNLELTVSTVHATTYPAVLYDAFSESLDVSSVNATDGQYAIVLNGTFAGALSGISAVLDGKGVVLQAGAEEVNVTDSLFLFETSYGVLIRGGAALNTISDNRFVGDNGASSSYSPAHVQASSVEDNAFNTCTSPGCETGVGNYWSDWQNGPLAGPPAPYGVNTSVAVWDYFPLPPATINAVVFTETGIPAKTLAKSGWTVVLGGTSEHATTTTIAFASVYSGSYEVLVTGPKGYVSTASGTLTVSGPTSVAVPFTKGPTSTLTFKEKELAKGQSWCVSLDGAKSCTTATSQKFLDLSPGTYAYAVVSPLGGQTITVTVGKSTSGVTGTLSVTKSETVTVTFAYVYEVIFSESGLAGGSWSVTVGGHTLSNAAGNTIDFYLVNGTYSYSVGKESGYSEASSPTKVVVHGGPTGVAVTFTPKGHLPAQIAAPEVGVAARSVAPAVGRLGSLGVFAAVLTCTGLLGLLGAALAMSGRRPGTKRE